MNTLVSVELWGNLIHDRLYNIIRDDIKERKTIDNVTIIKINLEDLYRHFYKNEIKSSKYIMDNNYHWGEYIKPIIKYGTTDMINNIMTSIDYYFCSHLDIILKYLVKYHTCSIVLDIIEKFVKMFNKYIRKEENNFDPYLIALCFLCSYEEYKSLDIIIGIWDKIDRNDLLENANVNSAARHFIKYAITQNNIKIVKYILNKLTLRTIDLTFYFIAAILSNHIEVAEEIAKNVKDNDIMEIKFDDFTFREVVEEQIPESCFGCCYVADIRSWYKNFKIESLEYLMDVYRKDKIKIPKRLILHMIGVSITDNNKPFFNLITSYFPHYACDFNEYSYITEYDDAKDFGGDQGEEEQEVPQTGEILLNMNRNKYYKNKITAIKEQIDDVKESIDKN